VATRIGMFVISFPLIWLNPGKKLSPSSLSRIPYDRQPHDRHTDSIKRRNVDQLIVDEVTRSIAVLTKRVGQISVSQMYFGQMSVGQMVSSRKTLKHKVWVPLPGFNCARLSKKRRRKRIFSKWKRNSWLGRLSFSRVINHSINQS